VPEGVSTYVYRVRRRSETFYLRILPEVWASFAPEALVHRSLRELGVLVPEVVFFEHRSPEVERSAMVTTEIPGEQIGHGPVDDATRRVLNAAGEQLAIINSVPVQGFGWIRRDRTVVIELEAEHPTLRTFLEEHLAADLALLTPGVLAATEAEGTRAVVGDHPEWFAAEQAHLAHGDFDVTAIFQQDGHYTGIIDFGEIRGADPWYDLGHFRVHDGETLPVEALEWLLEGYRVAAPLPPEHLQRICFASLLIAVRMLARALVKRPNGIRGHVGLRAIRRDLAVLRTRDIVGG